ncbi:FMN-dependent NADH-azoreductase [Edaphobacter dinghuensis]|uniref:FMN dependent NADH:quinone oxidoreductase n=1 Tax=Edaphobacter dinghuensis TaxID=1560005 RepID=A0A917M649_9BACT|nr:NAD(P)H-dependent oxidoreductase [Edaphobacter dinghuensis]GGG79755.1 FMN-dependent NADH-azoreductase 3 [Edaphobacter dinghuensis]
MPTLLHLDSSPLESSISRELTREFVKTWKAAHPDGAVIERDLAANPAAPINAAWVGSAFTPEAARTPEQAAALATSEQLIAELEVADEYVIGVAMHNFSVPSVLKLWIDQVARLGRTFSYGETGPQGLLKGKKATIIVASGGFYEVGTPAGAMNFVEPYLKAVLGFLGITDVKFVTASGASQLMRGTVDRATFLQPVLEQVRTVAA